MGERLASPRTLLHLLACSVLFGSPPVVTGAGARTIGMVADDGTDSVVVFDAEARTALGTVAVGSGVVGDCSISADRSTGFVTDFNHRLWVVDLEASPPALADPTPIAITNPGEDTALSVDGRHLLVCDGLTNAPISVVDVGARVEVSTFSLGSNCSSVDVCDDGSVLVASSNTGLVHRLVLDPATGALSASGDVLDTSWFGSRGPNNVHCAPGSASGVVVRRNPAAVLSFTVPDLDPVDSRTPAGTGFGLAAAFAPGSVLVRTGGGSVDVFGFDAATGALDPAPSSSVPSGPGLAFLGIDQLAVESTRNELWVPVSGVLEVRDPATGETVGSLAGAALSSPTGVCFASGEVPPSNLPPDCAGAVASVTELWPPRGGMEPVTVGGVLDPDGDPVELLVTAVRQDEARTGARGACVDAYVTGADAVALRARRAGGGDGRTYHVAFEASDGRGGTCTGVVHVCVPPEPGLGCGDQGPVVDSLASQCPAASPKPKKAKKK